MKQSVTAFLNQQDRDKFKNEHKVYQIDKDLAKKEEKRRNYRTSWACHVRFGLPIIDDETTFTFSLINEPIYEFLDNPCNDEITIKKYLESYDKDNKNNQTICLSQNMLIKLKNTLDDKIYKKLKDKIEILKLFVVYRSEYEIQYAIMYTENMTFKEQFRRIILEVFMNSTADGTSESFIQKIQFYENNGVNLKYIIDNILAESNHNELFLIIDRIYQDYLRKYENNE